MAKKTKRMTGFEDCTCSKCGRQAHTKRGTPHRWCQGSDKRARKALPHSRGVWN